MQAYVGGEVTASGRTKVPLPEVQEEVFDLSALEALAAQGMHTHFLSQHVLKDLHVIVISAAMVRKWCRCGRIVSW